MTARREHWDSIFTSREEEALTWYEGDAAVSLELISHHVHRGEPVIDVGGGASRLVDGLLTRDLGPISVLDLSEEALSISRDRLGASARDVCWTPGDITQWAAENDYALWHDRAVFHFLTEKADRETYLATMCSALRDNGIAIIATFTEGGPERCANLPVMRYTPETLQRTLGDLRPGCFDFLEARRHNHITPMGREQRFQISVFRRVPERQRL